jgi:hypothetical protein
MVQYILTKTFAFPRLIPDTFPPHPTPLKKRAHKKCRRRFSDMSTEQDVASPAAARPCSSDDSAAAEAHGVNPW